MNKIKLAGMSILSISLLTNCSNQKEENQVSEMKGVSVADMDTTVNPCDDFYLYANGTWIKNNPVPETESRWGNFNVVRDNNNKILKEILEKSAASPGETGTSSQKVGDFYYCAMDSVKLANEGIEPLKPELEKINAISSTDELIKITALHHKRGIGSIFSSGIDQDIKQSDKYICYISQDGLNLPDRDYYFRKDEKSTTIRTKYVEHITNMFGFLGSSPEEARKNAELVLKIETQLAEVSMDRVQLRDIEIQYNKMTYQDFTKSYSTIKWDLYFSELGYNVEELVVTQPDFFKKINTMITSTSLADWKVYLTWQLLHAVDHTLSPEIEQESFNFYATTLSGTKKMKPRWERSLSAVNNTIGELLGQEFVKVAFSAENKKRVNEMVDNLVLSYESHIKNLDWMSDETKERAIHKLKSISRKLAYPDKWKDYSALEIKRDSYLANWFRVEEFDFTDNISRLGKEVDKTEWHMPPQTVNAYYNPLLNEIVFPAGIMQPPFFTPDADDAVNYGSMGAVIGHELTHGFDDMGNKFDAEGNMKEWWSQEDRNQFNSKANVVVEQFDAYEPLDSLFVNGKLTLGENIADLGGVAISYDSYQMSLKGKERRTIDGFTPEQRFFTSYAQVWRGNYTEESLRQLVLTNPHSPGNYRVLGPLSNIPQFYEAFNCESGTNMVRADSIRAVIW